MDRASPPRAVGHGSLAMPEARDPRTCAVGLLGVGASGGHVPPDDNGRGLNNEGSRRNSLERVHVGAVCSLPPELAKFR
jgi:hypothetical protein